MKKLLILVAGGIGYVLGARAGRERYEQLRQATEKVKANPTVQSAAQRAAEAAATAAPVVKEKVAETAAKVTGDSGSTGDDSMSTSSAPAGGTTEVPMETSAYPVNDEDAKLP